MSKSFRKPTAETGCGMTINQKRFATYKSLSPVVTTRTGLLSSSKSDDLSNNFCMVW
jgi:hypothetical protein